MSNDDTTSTGDDHALPILERGLSDPWGIPEPGPTTLLAAIDGDQVPSFEEVRRRLENHDGVAFEFLGEPPERPDTAEWAHVMGIEDHPFPMVIWAEPVSPDACEAPAFAASARCMIGLQTLLDPAEPLTSWKLMVESVSSAAGEIVALLDVETEQWFPVEEVAARLRGPEATLEESMLFRVHAASTVEEPETADSVWLRTVGLDRCGRPELEMLEVPGEHLQTAHALLEALGALCIARGCPEPAVPFEAGIGLGLSLQYWAMQAELLSPGSIGTRAHRESMGGSDDSSNPLLGARAVVCGAEPRGSFREVFTWPRETIERLERGDAAIERTRSWTRARAREAQLRWPLLLEGCRQGARAHVCVALEIPSGGREHVWIEVESADEHGVSGRLVSTPANLEITPRASLKRPLEDVIDWTLTRESVE